MATAGYNSRIMVGAHHASLYARSASSSWSTEMLDDSRLAYGSKRYTPGLEESTFDIECLFDDDAAAGSWYAALKAAIGATTSPVTFAPEGFTAGDPAWVAQAFLAQMSVPTSINDRVMMPVTWQPSGDAEWGHALTALQTITSTTTGSAVDGGAATTGGAIANLHVSAISGSPSFVTTIQDSADASSWSTIGTFATASAAITSEHLALSGTIRRYTRAVCTITGGSTPSVTCQVSLARL